MGSSHNQQPAEIDPQTLRESRMLWTAFLAGSKYLVIGVAVLLLGMAFFLVG